MRDANPQSLGHLGYEDTLNRKEGAFMAVLAALFDNTYRTLYFYIKRVTRTSARVRGKAIEGIDPLF